MSQSSLGEEQMHTHTHHIHYFSHATHVGHDLNKSYCFICKALNTMCRPLLKAVRVRPEIQIKDWFSRGKQSCPSWVLFCTQSCLCAIVFMFSDK